MGPRGVTRVMRGHMGQTTVTGYTLRRECALMWQVWALRECVLCQEGEGPALMGPSFWQRRGPNLAGGPRAWGRGPARARRARGWPSGERSHSRRSFGRGRG
eukprot:3901707-Prymnesium_polylepis.2